MRVNLRKIRNVNGAAILLCALAGWEFLIALLHAKREPFWYDELLTFHMSGLPSLDVLWRALRAGVDGMPFGYYEIVRVARMAPGDPLVTLRLPSMIGYVLAILGAYWFARKRLPAAAALIPALVLVLAHLRPYAFQARPYALLVGFIAIAAALWQLVGERRFATPLLSVFLFLAVCCHHLAVLAIFPFALGEIAWSFLSHRARWGVWTAFSAATIPFLVNLSTLMNLGKIYGKNTWSRPTWSGMGTTYEDYIGLGATLAVVFIILFLRVAGFSARRNGDPSYKGFNLPETALIGGLLLYPAALVVLTKILHSGYVPRYGWPGVLGLAWGSAYLLQFARPVWGHVVTALLVAFLYQSALDLRDLRSPPAALDQRWARLEVLCSDEPSVPVVIASGTHYVEARQYAPASLQSRLANVVNPELAVRFINTDSVDQTNILLSQFIPLEVQRIGAFEAAHRRFLLYSEGSPFYDWFTDYALEKRYTLTLLAKDNGASLYMVDAD